MKKYIVTGAPGAGKTAVVRQLEVDGFAVVEEAATDVIALWQAKGITEPWTRPAFIDEIVALQQARLRRARCASDELQFHDRSAICTAALAEYLGFSRSELLTQEIRCIRSEGVFQKRVLFLENLGFIKRTDARRITYEEALRFEEIHKRVYRELGFELTPIGPGRLSARVDQIRQIVSSHGSCFT
jgi:predicted ATPase